MAEIKSGSNQFFLEDNGEVIATIEYEPSERGGQKLITITHTIVNEGHNGKGLGKQLVNKVALYAIENELQIIPECSYARKVLESNEQYRNLIVE
ncbi:GNAT family N-acetyltransferase [Bacillus andreraoultii]|uniref:GNAT family N-acetyltransferase n=1 Tax=Bacillus andreraoultii TaxID=1499685 RepID=UPI00053BBC75|nr:GNAT family N-acetyltransferase [Bacillus andreraoultii]